MTAGVQSGDSDTSREILEDQNNVNNLDSCGVKLRRKPKYGLIYLATIPPYMNVRRIKEFFGEFGKVGRVYLQLTDTDNTKSMKRSVKKSKKRNVANLYSEGWVEFERKHIAKKVAILLNNKQVDTRKRSKQYDCIWNIKYLSGFKWPHLSERLAYERAAKRQKLRTEIQVAKKKSNFFTANVGKKKNNTVINKELQDIDMEAIPIEKEVPSSSKKKELIQSLFV